jgi:hypothetical protein
MWQAVQGFRQIISLFAYASLPQMADFNTPRLTDAAGVC